MTEATGSTTVKEVIIKDMLEKTLFNRDTIEKVIAFQGEDLLKAFKEHSQVEISGFGVFNVAKGKVQKRIDRYTNWLEGDKPRTPEHEEDVRKLLEYLKIKQCQNLQNTLIS